MSTNINIRQDIEPEVTQLTKTLINSIPEIKNVLTTGREVSGTKNPSGDTQWVADERIDEVILACARSVDGIGQYVSEERAESIALGSGLSVATDPLDGSSNIKSNATLGTIIGVYEDELPACGRDLVASIILVLGPVTTLGVAANDELIIYTIKNKTIVGAESVEFPESGDVYAFSGNPSEWTPALQSYDEKLSHQYDNCYTGSMIADVWMLLERGGLVGYPKRTTYPNGVLRLQYESNPVAYAIECAGGAASTGTQSVLDLKPAGLHGQTPTFFGTQSLIEGLETRLEVDAKS